MTEHTLRDLGAAFDITGSRRIDPTTAGGDGHASCRCGAVSPLLPSMNQRKEWYRRHRGRWIGEQTYQQIVSKVIRTPGGCWRWTGYLNDGYGHSRGMKVHRLMVLSLGTVIPPGWEVDHLCRNRACVNPLHLEVVTKKVNTLRSTSASALNAKKTHCSRGHEFTAENTYRDRLGKRNCRSCGREKARRKRAERSAA